VVAQTQAGTRILAAGTLAPDIAEPQVLRERFTIPPELEGAPIEFRIDPADGEPVELFQMSLSGGPPVQ
jgi:hypothetical protein